ncbi:MAG: glycosyltransferase family 4 protein [Thermaerobacterales bacterium]
MALVVRPSQGGMLKAAGDLADGLAQRGFHVYWAGPPRTAAAPARIRELAFAWPSRTKPWHETAAMNSLGKALAHLQPDIIHAHGLRAGWLIRLALRRGLLPAEIPVIVTLHNMPGGGSKTNIRTAFWLNLEKWLPWPARYICVSKPVADWITSRLPALGPRTVVIHHGVACPPATSLDRLQARTRLGVAPDDRTVVIGVVARCSREKGIDLALAACSRLSPHLAQNQTWLLVVMGDGPELERLRAQSAALNMSRRVRFTGHVDHAEQYMAAFDLCLIPSRSEGLGMAALEALAAGVPVAASDTGGLREALDGGKAGCLVEAGSPAALSAAIERIAGDAPLRQSLVTAGRKHVLLNFHPGMTLDRHQALYETVAATWRPAGAQGPKPGW